jgi:hypothetical protein
MVAFNWKLMKEDLHGWVTVIEWSDSVVEQVAKEVKKNRRESQVRRMVRADLVEEFLPEPIKEAL